MVCGALAFAVSVQGGPRVVDDGAARDKAKAKSETARLVTGPSDRLNQVVAGGGATMVFNLTPVTTYPGGGIYKDGGGALAYTNANISGQTLTVTGGGFQSMWNLQVRDWNTAATTCTDVPRLRNLTMRIDEDDFMSGTGAALTRSTEACGGTGECITDYGEATPVCTAGTCDTMWINKTRTDGVFHTSTRCDAFACGEAIWQQGQGALLTFGSADPPLPDGTPCAPKDRHITEYFGSIAIEVPAGAAGTYTIGYVAAETFATDDNQPAPRA
jgi:hypothetical protein